MIRDDRVFYSDTTNLKAAVERDWAMIRTLDAKLRHVPMREREPTRSADSHSLPATLHDPWVRFESEFKARGVSRSRC